MTNFVQRYPLRAAADFRPGLADLILQASRVTSLWYERSRQRRALARLDDRMLRDIGIDRATAAEEASKPFWEA